MTSSSSGSSARDTDLIESLGAIIWEADPATFQFLYVNRAAERLLGYPGDVWLSRPAFWSEILHPDDRDGAVAARRSAVAERRDHDFEYRVIAADGSVRCIREIASVIRGEDGSVARLRGLMVEDRKSVV